MTRLAGLIFGALLAASAVAFVCYDARAWDRAAKIVDAGFQQVATDTSPVTERPGGIYLENDSYYWLSYANRIGDGETLRIRYTNADNAPYGREVHWSQSISWLLVVFGKTRQLITGESWRGALEQASVWLNPSLLILLSGGVGWALVWRVGPIPAGLFMVYLVSSGDVGWAFQPLRPGHQTLHCLFGMLMLAGLVFGGAGWIRVGPSGAGSKSAASNIGLEIPGLQHARRWFFVSGVFAALSLWVSAAVGEILLLMLFGAGLVLALSAPNLPEGGDVQIKPELWRRWGWIAGAGSFLFYLLEYFPNHLAFHLEVNGPLYSLGVVVMGEALCQFLRARYAKKNHVAAPFAKGLACTAIVALIPFAIFFGPPAWHALRDPQMLRLHSSIQEFGSFATFAGSNPGALFFSNLGILPLFLVLAIALTTFSDLRLGEWAVLWLSLAVTLGLLGLGYMQIRWLGLYAAMNAWLAVVAGVCAWRLLRARLPDRIRSIVGFLLVTALLVQPVLFMSRRCRQVNDIVQQRTAPKSLTNPVLNKRLALAFRAAEGAGTRVMADLDFAAALQYFGEGSGVASYYWENLDGLHAATKFFADSDGEAARQIARERGLTHIAVPESDRLENYFYFYDTGKTDQEAAGKTFAARLLASASGLPDWLQTTPTLQEIGSPIYTYCGARFENRWRLYRIRTR